VSADYYRLDIDYDDSRNDGGDIDFSQEYDFALNGFSFHVGKGNFSILGIVKDGDGTYGLLSQGVSDINRANIPTTAPTSATDANGNAIPITISTPTKYSGEARNCRCRRDYANQ
jgi:hypothetical protein